MDAGQLVRRDAGSQASPLEEIERPPPANGSMVSQKEQDNEVKGLSRGGGGKKKEEESE